MLFSSSPELTPPWKVNDFKTGRPSNWTMQHLLRYLHNRVWEVLPEMEEPPLLGHTHMYPSRKVSIFKVGLAVFMPLFFWDVMLQDGYPYFRTSWSHLERSCSRWRNGLLTCNDEPDKLSQTLGNQLHINLHCVTDYSIVRRKKEWRNTCKYFLN
jgi:hypothetical protein